MSNLIRTCESVGLTWAVPFLRLARQENPNEQAREILLNLGVPLISVLIFIGAWSWVAAHVKVSFGAVPGPTAVWIEAKNLWANHAAERLKESEFYQRQAERKKEFLAEKSGGEWRERTYAGSPTYIDQIFTSLKTVFTGFIIAALIAVPLGILCGLSKVFNTAINPFIQIFKPVSPLAWLPIVMIMVSALYNPKDPMFQKSFITSAFTVALCSLWPALINTSLGVATIDNDYLNVARVLKLGWWKKVTKIVIPSALPLIFTGLRLSLGVGWMVLIAAEMLAQNPGLGKFVWDMFQNGSSQTLAQIMVAVFTIGFIGFFLDRIMMVLQRAVSFDAATIRCPMAFLELKNVCKGYGFGAKRAEVLRDINLSIGEGEFVAIIGYSGSGKTTLMSLKAGLQHPDEGTVTLRGELVKEPSPDRAIVFQNYSLLPWLTVHDNIALAVDEVFSSWPADQRREHVEKFIAMVNLTPARDKKPWELSGGMRQRVSVARALAMDPKILLLDEPLSALDALTRAVLQDEIARIWSESKKTVVLITNDVDEGIMVADRIIPLSSGPGATLGASVNVDIERPRDRKALNHDPRFKAIRKEVIGYLIGKGGRPKASVTRKLVLPDIEPEDLTLPRGSMGDRTVPVRRNEIKNETVEVE